MNYRHDFHAGNFADVVKHAAFLRLLRRLTAESDPLLVIDTHAGAGTYDLQSPAARASNEAAAGVGRLMADNQAPAVFKPLKAAVAAANPGGGLRVYPGSPVLALGALRARDRLAACELNPEAFAVLKRNLTDSRAEAVRGDGFVEAPRRLRSGWRSLVLIDPPFERRDDYDRLLAAIGALVRREAGVCVMAWLPLKDLETFDRFLRGLEPLAAPVLIAEARLRGLDEPMRLNGCALAVVNDPPGLEAELAGICGWTAVACGESTARAQVWRL